MALCDCCGKRNCPLERDRELEAYYGTPEEHIDEEEPEAES